MDRVQHLVNQWADVRPDLDLDVMALVARLVRVGQLLDGRIDALAADYGLHRGEGDVVFALYRGGPPHRQSPTQLASALLITTGTMTNRLDRLERRELVRRIPNPEDRRGLLIELTPAGRELADRAVTQHLVREHDMVAPLSAEDRAELDRLARVLIEHLER